MKIAENLRKEMARQRLSEYALGKRSGVPQPTIHRILTGETRNPKARTLDPLARALGLSQDELFHGAPRQPGLPVRDEAPTYDAEVQRLVRAIESQPPRDRAHFRWLLTRLLNRPS